MGELKEHCENGIRITFVKRKILFQVKLNRRFRGGESFYFRAAISGVLFVLIINQLVALFKFYSFRLLVFSQDRLFFFLRNLLFPNLDYSGWCGI